MDRYDRLFVYAAFFHPVLIPYVLLYLSSQMFYWWPLGTIRAPCGWSMPCCLWSAPSLI
jgi:hypothetical protein